MSYITSFERIGFEDGFENGFEKGRQEGIERGVQKGEGLVLLSLIETKFKFIPENYLQKVRQANSDTLLVWAKRLLNAKSIDEVFEF